ncbi:MAG: hypothetical protein E6678_00940 [Staphylococcus epidermidis]|nr:hypothetical protein [Staphylococcus epidermidis]
MKSILSRYDCFQIDWVGHQIDKGIDKYIDFKTKEITLEVKGALHMKNKL